MDSGLITIFLPLALAVVMAGLGLELTPNDFKRSANTLKQYWWLYFVNWYS